MGATVAFCAVAAELGVRVVDGDRLNQWRLSSAAEPAPPGLSRGEMLRLAALRFNRRAREVARRYVDELPVDPGVSRSWFDVSPDPLPRAPLPADLEQVAAALDRYPVPASEMFKAWNTRFIQESVCSGDGFFRRFPGFAFAFEPPEPSPHPRYRYLSNVTTPAGLVTNRFGWRGRDLATDKAPGIVRIAFVGASTTVGSHLQAFSYPELLERWLNLWADREAPAVRFEVINAGREGISSTDIAAVVRQELPAVAPDIIVYYEGANQFSFRALIAEDGEAIVVPESLNASRRLAGADRSALLRRVEVAMRRLRLIGSGSEPRKPRYVLRWPASVREDAPNPDSPALPLDLPRIVRDLDDIHRTAQGIGAQFMLTSFVWMVENGMVVDPVDHAYLYQSLNLAHWPARYADIRRMADFQNRVFRAYAKTRELPFIDLAAVFPRDLRLFGDAVHLTVDGDRLHAWMVLQAFVPILRADLKAGRVPVPARKQRVGEMPVPPPTRVAVECTDFSRYRTVPGAVSLESIRPSVPEAQVLRGAPVQVITPEARSAYAAEMPIAVRVGGPVAIRLRLRVRSGHVSVGVLSSDRSKWLVIRDLGVSADATTLYLSLSSLDDAGFILITNAVRADGERSAVDIESVEVLSLGS